MLGEQKTSYYGTSYGTYLGAVYATMYPQRTDRVVLDSVNEPSGNWRNTFREQTREYLHNTFTFPYLAQLWQAVQAGNAPCAFWPYQEAEPTTRITDHGPSNILLVQNERDPATPIEGAVACTRRWATGPG